MIDKGKLIEKLIMRAAKFLWCFSTLYLTAYLLFCFSFHKSICWLINSGATEVVLEGQRFFLKHHISQSQLGIEASSKWYLLRRRTNLFQINFIIVYIYLYITCPTVNCVRLMILWFYWSDFQNVIIVYMSLENVYI